MSTWNKHYHWKTKNVTPWSKQYFTEKLVGASHELASPTKGAVIIDSVSLFDGDVELGNRKGRLITIYDCQLTLDWSGQLDSGAEATGTVFFPEVSHEVQDEGQEYRFNAALSDGAPKGSTSAVEKQAMLAAVRAHLVPSLLPHFHAFRDELIASHAKDVGHEDSATPGSGASTPVAAAASAAPKAGASSAGAAGAKTASAPSTTPSLSTTDAEVQADLSIRRDDLWDLLTNPARIPMWTRAPAQLTLNPGSTFSLFNGNVVGSVLSVDVGKELVQKWRAPQWPAQHFGTLTTTLTEGESSTTLRLHLSGVPLEEKERSQDALDRFYLAGLKTLGLGTGSVM